MDGWVRWQGSRPELLEGGVALQSLGERHATLGAELVVVEPAHTAKEKGGWEGQVQHVCACCRTVRRGWVWWQGSRQELLEGRIALQGFGERHATLGAELVLVEPAHTAEAG